MADSTSNRGSFGSALLPTRRRVLQIAALGAATVTSGVLHGRLTRRWGTPDDLDKLGKRLEELPANVGPWKLRESSPLEPAVANILECTGSIKRLYAHETSGAAVNIAVMCGPSGPISVHTPEVCYSSRAFAAAKPRERIVLDTTPDRRDEFWAVTFQHRRITQQMLRVYYAWTRDRPWTAAESPRFTYRGEPWLYKLQLATETSLSQADAESDPGREFLRTFVPLLDGVLGMEA